MVADATRTGADLFVATLEEYGVRHLFGNPGTTELPLVDAIQGSDVEYVLGLHEDVAVGAAAGYASARRYHAHDDPAVNPLGVVNLHVAPGVAHGLGNLYGAAFTGAPLLVTAGSQSMAHQTRDPILSGDVLTMVEDYTKWCATVPDGDALPRLVRRAVRTALTPPTGPVFLELPFDVQTRETTATPEPLGSIPTPGAGDPAAIERAVDLLADADEPVLVVGDQIAQAGPEAVAATVEVAEQIGARVHGELFLGEASFPTDHDHWTSFLPIDPDEAEKLLAVDTVAFLGCSTNVPMFDFDGEFVTPTTTCLHVGHDAEHLGKNFQADVSVLGDPGRSMHAIAERLRETVSEDRLAERRTRRQAVQASVDERRRATASADPDDPRPSKLDLAEALAEIHTDEIIVDEGVTAGFVLRDEIDVCPGEFLATKSGGLGYGLPAAIGATIAQEHIDSHRNVVGFVGDGAFQYYPQAMYTAARYVGSSLAVVVADNRGYGILRGEHAENGTQTDAAEMSFDPPIDPAALAESYGIATRTVETIDDLPSGLSWAIDADQPTLLRVHIQG